MTLQNEEADLSREPEITIVIEGYNEKGGLGTAEEALEALFKQLEANEARKKEQAEKGFDGLTYFVYRSLLDAEVDDAEAVSQKIKTAFGNFPNWQKSEASLRELRQKVTFAIAAGMDDLDKVVNIVDQLFTILDKANRG